MTEPPFNPLAMPNLAESIITQMMLSEPTPLDTVPVFTGAGLYAIYYYGSFPAYAPLSSQNQDGIHTKPIYVGKAVPEGGRRGLDVVSHTSTKALSTRLRSDHAASIRAATNLDIAEFSARWLVVEDIWIPLGESAMLRRHRPIWNALVDGFGNHDPGKGRRNGVRSRWDTLHPGRSYAVNFPPRPESTSAIEQEIAEYLRSRA